MAHDALRVEIPLRLYSTANSRVHWSIRARWARLQREAVWSELVCRQLPPLPAVVTMTRIGPRLLDSDNLAISFKSVRDQIAEHMGEDDRSDAYTWVCQQRVGPRYAVHIEIKERHDEQDA